MAKRMSKKMMNSPVVKAKMRKTMKEWKAGELRSGSKKGPIVTNRLQAVAIGLSSGKRSLVKKRAAGARKRA